VTGLKAVCKYGLEITHAAGHVGPMTEVVKPLAFAATNTLDVDELDAVTSIFGGSLLGATLDIAQQTQSVWNFVPGSAVWGGHAFMGGAYTGVDTNDIEVISWQQPYGTSDSFITNQVDQGFILILPIILNHVAFQTDVNLAAMAADYTDLTGKPLPA